MATPIRVNEYGEMVAPYPVHSHHSDFDTPDNAPIKEMQHVLCGGIVTLNRVAERWQALHCGRCGLRVSVPTSVRTFADLRQHAAKYNAAWFVNAESTTD